MSFEKVLIANRGEIAVRLIRACRALDLQSVAVYSEADAQALHVELADESVLIGPAEARASYLNVESLIQAALQSGAGAIHPGYGFLAENAEFAQACQDAGLVFVGPSPQVIASMGAKIEAKRIAEEAGVSCVPGYHGDDQSDPVLLQAAEKIGVPLLIKASAGGGGRGMRLVENFAEFLPALGLAREEAKAAFGNPSVLLERFVTAPRHIEVQILGDQHGNVRHLFERDCSVQRNYQKVIEEAPAPNLPAKLRGEILQQAVQLAESIGYNSAGTVEFVVDAQANQAYFLEMNTRLQVEHPVTEMVTGLDLAAWQLRIALGEPIDFAQDEVRCQGWAIEARLAAENPAAGYQAQTGVLQHYQEPALEGLRVDSGVHAGSVISPYYDSMLAKLIAFAPDRSSALRKLRRGLSSWQLSGVGVNRDFLQQILEIPDFATGRHLTNLLTQTWPEGWRAPETGGREQALAVLCTHLLALQKSGETAWRSLGAWRLGEPCGRVASASYYVMADEPISAMIYGRDTDFRVELAGETVLQVTEAKLAGQSLSYVAEGQAQTDSVSWQGDSVCLHDLIGQPEFCILPAEKALLGKTEQKLDHGNAVLAPTPGQVVELLVAAGDVVAQGQPVVVLEAMKMLQQLCAGQAGRVAEIFVQAGDPVNSGDCLAKFVELDD